MRLLKKWLLSSGYRQGLDSLFTQTPSPTDDLRLRLDWLAHLVHWIRTVGSNANELQMTVGKIENARCKYILQVLERNPDIKIRVAECLRSIIRDTRALELFMHVGMSEHGGFFGEFFERLLSRFLPAAPHDQDLISVFSMTFQYKNDAIWIRQIESEVFQGWLDLFNYQSFTPWNTLVHDAKDALYLLGQSVRTVGLSPLVRNRVTAPHFRALPFFELSTPIDALITAEDDSTRSQAYRDFNAVLERCFRAIDEVHAHFKIHGVSIAQVYQMECLKTQLRRSQTLTKLLIANEPGAHFVQEFFALMVIENVRYRKLRKLLQDNLVLVCQKIVETNAETGEHYITRDHNEYMQIIKKSLGGGFITAFTTLLKFALSHLSAPPFFLGLFAFTNYSLSFIAIQLFGFTLATKQPAMTATALSAKIEESPEALGDEVIHLIRSQFAAVIGNIVMVVPMVVLIDLAVNALGSHLTDRAHAYQIMSSFSIFGATPWYAAFTGVLLWLSSVFAGWFGNWFHFRGLSEAIEHHRRLRYVFGTVRCKRFAEIASKNAAGIAANVSLAFFLGMIPFFAQFLGLPLDVRHVTLSSGALTAAVMSIGSSVFSDWKFWHAVLGIVSMAFLNLGVSFTLALSVAIWAKNSSRPNRGLLYRDLFLKLIRRPWALFFPASPS